MSDSTDDKTQKSKRNLRPDDDEVTKVDRETAEENETLRMHSNANRGLSDDDTSFRHIGKILPLNGSANGTSAKEEKKKRKQAGDLMLWVAELSRLNQEIDRLRGEIDDLDDKIDQLGKEIRALGELSELMEANGGHLDLDDERVHRLLMEMGEETRRRVLENPDDVSEIRRDRIAARDGVVRQRDRLQNELDDREREARDISQRILDEPGASREQRAEAMKTLEAINPEILSELGMGQTGAEVDSDLTNMALQQEKVAQDAGNVGSVSMDFFGGSSANSFASAYDEAHEESGLQEEFALAVSGEARDGAAPKATPHDVKVQKIPGSEIA